MNNPSKEPSEATRGSVKLMRGLKIALLVFLSVIMLFLIAVAALNIAKQIAYREFFSTAESNADMPGLMDGFIPQGLENYADGFIMSGYMNNKGPSRIYILDGEGKYTAVELYKANGDSFTGHAGGIAVSDGYVYVGGSNGLYVFSEADVSDGDGRASQIGFFDAGLTCAWVQVYGDYVIAGSFYEEPDYTTESWQHVTTPSGEEHKSMMLVFNRDPEADLGIDLTPVCALSVRNKVQGAAFTEEGVILSTSLGLGSSVLYFYKPDVSNASSIRVGGEGDEIPLLYLDSTTLTYEMKLPPMAEEIAIRDGRVYVSNESACLKYYFGLLNGGWRFYSFQLKDEYFAPVNQ